MLFEAYHADSRDKLKELIDQGVMVDSIVTDPPYELSNCGKTSPNRVFFEMMFPKNSKIKSDGSSENYLPFFINKVFELSSIGLDPSKSSTMPIGAMTFNNDFQFRNDDIINTKESSIGISDSITRNDIETENSKHLGSFFLELTDSTKLFQLLNHAGSGFFSGKLGIGFRVCPSSFPSFFHSLCSIGNVDYNIWFSDSAFSDFISTCLRTESEPILTFDLVDSFNKNLTTTSASIFLTILYLSGAKLFKTKIFGSDFDSQLIGTLSTTSGLPSMFKSTKISVVDDSANLAFSFNIITHKIDITTKGFMGKEWDGSKIAFDVGFWRQCYDILKPGGYLLAFAATRNYHRMTSCIEDAGFEIKDTISYIFGQGFPKSLNISKQLEKKGDLENAEKWKGFGSALKPAHEMICLARRPLSEKTIVENVIKHGTGGINIDGCRVAISNDDPNQRKNTSTRNSTHWGNGAYENAVQLDMNKGRFPANLIHSCFCSEYMLKSDVTSEQKKQLQEWLNENSKCEMLYV